MDVLKKAEYWRQRRDALDRQYAVRLSTEQQDVLISSSMVNGMVFAPTVLNSNTDFEQTMIVGANLALSLDQHAHLQTWANVANDPNDQGWDEHGITLNQNMVSDCSFVSSLCAILHHQVRFGYVHFPNHMSPDNNGNFPFTLYFNGCSRIVTVDPTLPLSKDGILLHVFSPEYPTLLWPALLEKAYLSIMGPFTYCFAGSDSSLDISVLINWIPQKIKTSSLTLEFWSTLAKEFNNGLVLLTVGSKSGLIDDSSLIFLIPQHSYAILEMNEHDGNITACVRNPWRGQIAHNDTIDSNVSESFSDIDRNDYIKISLEKLKKYFDTLYLSWNPLNFVGNWNHHFRYDFSSEYQLPLFKQPQFCISIDTECSLIIVLSRHIINYPLAGHCGIKIYEVLNNKRIYEGISLQSSKLLDSRIISIPFTAKPNKFYMIAINGVGCSRKNTGYTLSAFWRSGKCDICPVTELYQYHNECNGYWSVKSAGGSNLLNSYINNPKFSLVIPQETPIYMGIEMEGNEPIHLDVLFESVEVRPDLLKKDIFASTLSYRSHFASFQLKKIPRGKYIVIASTFDSGKCGNFKIYVSTQYPIEINSVSSNSAGKFMEHLHGMWRTGELEKSFNILSPGLCTATIVFKSQCPIRMRLADQTNKDSSPWQLADEGVTLGPFNVTQNLPKQIIVTRKISTDEFPFDITVYSTRQVVIH